MTACLRPASGSRIAAGYLRQSAMAWLSAFAVAAAPAARGAEPPQAAAAGKSLPDGDSAAASAEAHARHHLSLTPPTLIRSTANYAIPDAVTMTRADGTRVHFAQELDDGRPVLLNFIYTTCSTICPVVSQAFTEVQSRLGVAAAKVRMASVSIDPEQDTPARLTEYAARFDAGPQWQFYTGTYGASVALQRVFNVYRGDKMGHAPVTFYRSAPGQAWVRLDGFATPEALLSELRPSVALMK